MHKQTTPNSYNNNWHRVVDFFSNTDKREELLLVKKIRKKLSSGLFRRVHHPPRMLPHNTYVQSADKQGMQ